MKKMLQKLTALLSAGAMLGSFLPTGVSASGHRVHTRGTFAVLWSKDGYTLLRGIKLENNNTSEGCYLLATDEMQDTMPEGSPPVKRGDLIHVPETSAIAASINRHPYDVMGYSVQGIVEVDEDGDYIYISGESEIVGTVFDDPQYGYYQFGGLEEEEGWKYTDRDGVEYSHLPITYVYLKTPGFAGKGLRYPASCAEGTDVDWADYMEGDEVCMLTYEGIPVFPEKDAQGQFAAVVSVQGEGEKARYLLRDLEGTQGYSTLSQSDVTKYAGADVKPDYGSILYYDVKTILDTPVRQLICDETSKLQLRGHYNMGYAGASKPMLVTGNDGSSVFMKDEDGNAYSYSYRISYKDCGFTDGIDPYDLKADEIWEFVMLEGKPVLPLRLLSYKTDEEQPVNALIVESVSPDNCVIQSHVWRSHFGQAVQDAYHDYPFQLPTNDIVTCLGAYPEVGDILECSIIAIQTTELYGGVNDGCIMPEDGGPLKEGMIRRTGNILTMFEPKEYTVTFGGDFSQYWQIRDGSLTHKYLSLGFDDVKSGDTVTFATYYGHPAFPLPAEKLRKSITAAVEALGKDKCVIRCGSRAFRWQLSELTACLGESPMVGDVIEITPDAHFLWENTGTRVGLMDAGLYKTTPEKGLVKRLGNCINDGETIELRLGWTTDWNGLKFANLTWKNYHIMYGYYDTAEYPDNSALSPDEAGANDTVIFAAFQGEPMLPVGVAEYRQGDLDNSGKLDILDVVAINKSILGVKELSKAAQKAADLNGDGRMDADDSLCLLKLVLDIS